MQSQAQHWCAKSIRALSGFTDAAYRGRQLWVAGKPHHVNAPHLQFETELDAANKETLRGIADGIALRLRYSDLSLHKQQSPDDPIERLVFDLLEQIRAESLVPTVLVGVKTNLQQRFLCWAEQVAQSPLTNNHIGILLYTLIIMTWSRLHRQILPELIDSTIESTRFALAPLIGVQLQAMTQQRHQQAVFAKPAVEIARIIHKLIEQHSESVANSAEPPPDINQQSALFNWLNIHSDNTANAFGNSVQQSTAVLENPSNYRIFTTEHDKQVSITDRVRAAQLNKFRQQLDTKISQQPVNRHRIARHLGQLLASPHLAGWQFNEEQGHLDAARLARLITSPKDHRIFKQEAHQAQSDCIISILVDNSGSMTHYQENTAILIDTLSRIFDLANCSSEVLGFTTGDWHGGKVLKQWHAAGKPDKPGRLNSIMHTVYKSAQTPWRRARPAVAGLMATHLFKESFDGEAINWAAKRLLNRSENKKILLFISDGSPMDTATLANNEQSILDQHLIDVATDIQSNSPIALCALGLGLDLSRYFKHALPIDLNTPANTRDYFAIANLLHQAQVRRLILKYNVD